MLRNVEMGRIFLINAMIKICSVMMDVLSNAQCKKVGSVLEKSMRFQSVMLTSDQK